MKGLKKVTAAALVAAMMMSGCSGIDASWIAKSGDITVPAGVYASSILENYMYGYMMSGSSYLDGEGVVEELETYAKDYVTTLLGYQKKANELGVALTEEEKEAAHAEAEELWNSASALYTANRISKESMAMTYEISSLSANVFEALYGEGGEKEVPAEELRQIFDDYYLKGGMLIFQKPTQAEISETSTEEQKAQVKETYEKSLAEITEKANYWLEQANVMMTEKGLSFNDVIIAYDFENTALENNDDINVGDRMVFLDKRAESVPAEVIEFLETAEHNTVALIESEEYFVVCCAQDKNEKPEEYDKIKGNILLDYKSEEMLEYMEEYISNMEVEFNQAALDRFAPKNMTLGY